LTRKLIKLATEIIDMKFLKYCLLICLLTVATNEIFSQGPGGPPPPVNPTGTPIDGGIGLLLAAGVAYGSRKLRAKKATKKTEV